MEGIFLKSRAEYAAFFISVPIPITFNRLQILVKFIDKKVRWGEPRQQFYNISYYEYAWNYN